jgi:putative Mg2+ transporter-C (MgtC) family protein
VCRAEDEALVRALLVQAFSSSAFTLRELQSEDISGSTRVKVRAFLLAHGVDQTQLEQAVSRLSLEPGISAVSWQLRSPDTASMSGGEEDAVQASTAGWQQLTGPRQ